MEEGLIIKLVGILKRNIKDKTLRLSAYKELLPFLKQCNFNPLNGLGVCKIYDDFISKGGNRSHPTNNKNSPPL